MEESSREVRGVPARWPHSQVRHWHRLNKWPACRHRAASGQGEAEDILFLLSRLSLGHRTLEVGTVRRWSRRQDLEKGGREGLITLIRTHTHTRARARAGAHTAKLKQRI